MKIWIYFCNLYEQTAKHNVYYPSRRCPRSFVCSRDRTEHYLTYWNECPADDIFVRFANNPVYSIDYIKAKLQSKRSI